MFFWEFYSDVFALQTQILTTNWTININPVVRLSCNSANNTGDLNNANDDKMDYPSYIYKIPIGIKYKGDDVFFINILSEGPAHYAAPLKDVFTTIEGWQVKKRGGFESALYPAVNEVWVKMYPKPNISLQIGQSAYKVGNGYALGGHYNNYGITIEYKKARLRYAILDIENGMYGIRKDTITKWDLAKNYDSEASMISTDARINLINQVDYVWAIQPYIGFLYDHTSQDKRNQHGYFTNATGCFPVDKDKIYTYGVSTNLKLPSIGIEFEMAKNSGKTTSRNKQQWKDIEHNGYLVHTAVKGYLGMFIPRAKIVIASGNKTNTTDPKDWLAGTLKRTTNHAFTVFSPLNTNLVDTYAHSAPVPVVSMAYGYTMNYGIRRPGTFNDPHVWENLIATNIGLNVALTEKIFLMLDYWRLSNIHPGIGIKPGATDYEYLPTHLGDEIDLYASYSVTRSIMFGIHGGYFMPGEYYKISRIDTVSMWNNNQGQSVRTDGLANNVYQVELFMLHKF
ncbi:MAG: hypothetical protein AB1297_04580 [bacterium]